MQWWEGAAVYEVYVRSFTDADGDGVGDLAGLAERLGYLELLGVDAIWLAPIFPSPMVDHGYDVSDPRDVDPVHGTLEVFDALVTTVHDRGMKLLLDLVPNHTSARHPWFVAALESGPGSAERARYHFRTGREGRPPNNWRSAFGGSAWTRVGDTDQWYLHLYAPEQPDLNWTNPEVWADLEKTLLFWLDRGVDGFRIDVAHGMSKPAGLPDIAGGPDLRFDDEGVHEVHRLVRAVLDHHPDKVVVGEVRVRDRDRFARYLRPDELHLALGVGLVEAPFRAAALRAAVEDVLVAAASVGGTPAWALGGHDVSRTVTRYGGGEAGLARARAMALMMLALPGAVFLYQGEELGLADVDVPEEARRDPIVTRSRRTARGRDGFRVPIPWEGGPPGYGFTTGTPWLPMPESFGERAVEAQLEDRDSTLSLYRRALELRRAHPAFTGPEIEWFGAPEGCLAFRRSGSTLVCALNASETAVPLPIGEVLLASGRLDDGFLPPDTSAWLV